MSVYVLDSNYFIQSFRGNYPFDVVPNFWTKTRELAERGVIVSIDRVKAEISSVEDDLYAWCERNLAAACFKDTSEVIASYLEIARWAASRSGHYLPKAIEEFLDADEADAWLISYAHADAANRIIVTNELAEPKRRNKIKIPDVCSAYGIQCRNPIEMFRELHETF